MAEIYLENNNTRDPDRVAIRICCECDYSALLLRNRQLIAGGAGGATIVAAGAAAVGVAAARSAAAGAAGIATDRCRGIYLRLGGWCEGDDGKDEKRREKSNNAFHRKLLEVKAALAML